MKKDFRDMLDDFYDENIEIKNQTAISYEKILDLTKQKIKECNKMKVKPKKKIFSILSAAALICAISVTVVAAANFLTAEDVSNHFGDSALAQSIKKDGSEFNLEPQSAGDYSVNILGMVSGKNLSEYSESDANKTYIVGAILRKDGKEIKDYTSAVVSPLISGYDPVRLNTWSLNANMQRFILDGVEYFILNCENIEVFADHNIYISVLFDGSVPNKNIFPMDKDGNLSINETSKTEAVLFKIPIDKSKADPKAAEKILSNIN